MTGNKKYEPEEPIELPDDLNDYGPLEAMPSFVAPDSDSVTIDSVTVKCGDVWDAATIACTVYALASDEINYSEALEKIEGLREKRNCGLLSGLVKRR